MAKSLDPLSKNNLGTDVVHSVTKAGLTGIRHRHRPCGEPTTCLLPPGSGSADDVPRCGLDRGAVPLGMPTRVMLSLGCQACQRLDDRRRVRKGPLRYVGRANYAGCVNHHNAVVRAGAERIDSVGRCDRTVGIGQHWEAGLVRAGEDFVVLDVLSKDRPEECLRIRGATQVAAVGFQLQGAARGAAWAAEYKDHRPVGYREQAVAVTADTPVDAVDTVQGEQWRPRADFGQPSRVLPFLTVHAATMAACSDAPLKPS